MKNIIKISLLLICLFFGIFGLLNSNNITLDADTVKTVDVVDDSGNIVYYRKSTEAIQRLSEYNYPTQSLRAAWVSHYIGSMPKFTTVEKWKSDYNAILDNLESLGFNCIVFHVRTHNNALYKSELNPKASFISDCNLDEFDPLEYCIEETHRRGMEFHAWLNPYRVKSGTSTFCSEDYPSVNPASNPDNLLVGSSTTILNPGIPEVRQFIVDSCMELIENYDVDAINFDDYFYIKCDDSATEAKYNTTGMDSDDWHREQVNLFIKSLSESIKTYNKKNNKAVQLGIAPSGTYRNGGYVTTPTYNDNGDLTYPLYSDTASSEHYPGYLYADTLKWVTNEWIDYMMPQAYWALEHTNASFASLSRWWSWAVHYKKVNLYMGMGIYMAESSSGSGAYWRKNSNEIRDQILNAATHEEIGGICMYSYNYLNSDNTVIKNGINLLKNDYFSTKIPCDVKKAYAGTLEKPNIQTLTITGNILSFEKVDNVRGYMIYKVPNGETLNQDNINHVYYYGTDNEVTLEDLNSYNYYISTVNLANEISDPININLLNNNGEYVKGLIDELPSAIYINDEKSLNRIKDLYNNLTLNERLKVTNYQLYLDKVSLLASKKTVIEIINDYGNLTLYSVDTKQKIKYLKNEYKGKIEKSESSTDVDNLEKEFKQKFSEFQIASIELKVPMDTAKIEIKAYYDSFELCYYTNDNQSKLLEIYHQACLAVDDCNSQLSISNVVKNAKSSMDEVENFKVEYESIINELINYLNGLRDFELDYNALSEMYSNRISDIATVIETKIREVDKLLVIENSDSYYETINTLFDEGIEKLEKYDDSYSKASVRIKRYNENYPGVTELKEEYLQKILDVKSSEEVDNLLNEANDKYKGLIDEYNKSIEQDPITPTEETKKSCKNGSIIILRFSMLLSLLLIIIRRKK